jgi:hypothetical protein
MTLGIMTHSKVTKPKHEMEKRHVILGAKTFGKMTLGIMTHSKVAKLKPKMEKDALDLVLKQLAE